MQTPKTDAPIEIQIWPIDRLVLYARNPRKNDAVVDRMCSSIREFGFKIPVLARSDGEVVDAHLRIKAARKLRIEEIPVILCDKWTPAQVKAFRLMVNRSVNWALWDDELLALELQELSDADFDLSLSGFDDADVTRLLAAGDAVEGLTDEDSVPEIPETPIARPADLWELGVHKLLVGDATDITAVHRLMAGDAADLVFTDPPYNVAYEGYTEERLTI
jgi:ParB-like chromosome segregation protein Spo0J